MMGLNGDSENEGKHCKSWQKCRIAVFFSWFCAFWRGFGRVACHFAGPRENLTWRQIGQNSEIDRTVCDSARSVSQNALYLTCSLF